MAIKLKLLVYVMVAAALLQGSEAQTSHVVLGTSGWIVPGSAADYVTWANAQTFAVGDFLLFNYATGAHDVAEVSKTAYEGCTKTNPIITETTGPTNITLSTAGEHYYICTVGGHCSQGQKLAINVTAGTTTSTPPPPGTTTASPPPPGTTTTSPPPPGATTAPPPPPSSAATPLATATLPMITLFSIVLAMLH